MDNFFSNVELAKFLEGRNTYTIGTARVNSKGWPLALKNIKALTKELERGDHRSAMVLDSVQCQIWKDKKAVAFINAVCSPIQLKHRCFGEIKMVQGSVFPVLRV
jgi:hypothetical protein